MIDFHCHLDLYKEPMHVFEQAKRKNKYVLAVTTSPKAFVKTSQYFKSAKNIMVALGFHPELVSTRTAEKKLFFDCMDQCLILGEIGIDGSVRSKSSLNMQEDLFKEVLIQANFCGGRIMSIHSRGAVKETLQIIDKYSGKSKPVLHWFTGSQKEVEKALSIGCWFSINPNMCKTNAGNKILPLIPIERVLPETDAPFTQKNAVPYMPWDTTVTMFLSNFYGLKFEEMNLQFEKNLRTLLNSIKL